MSKKRLLKWITFSIIAVFMCTLSCSAESTLPFRDISEGDWYYESVQNAYDEGIIKGVSDSQFAPDGTVTREMFLTMLGRTVDIDPSMYENDSNSFSDVLPDQWYSSYINWGVKMGIVKGIGNNEFGIGQAVTREQMAVFLARCIYSECGVSLKESETDFIDFKDKEKISDWASDSLDLMQSYDIFKGDENAYFYPQKMASRAEGAAVMMRLLDVFEGNEEIIKLFDEVNTIVLKRSDGGLPVSVTISDDAAVKDILNCLQNAAVLSSEKVRESSGWTYWMSLYDSDENYLAGYRFENDSIVIGNILINTEKDSFQSIIDQITE